MKYLWLSLFFCAAAFGQADAIDPTLDQLDAAGKNLKSFVTDVTLTTTDTSTGDAETQVGKVWYDQNNGQPRIRVQFNSKTANGHRDDSARHEYELIGPDLIDRDVRGKTQHTHHVLKPGEKIDLFKLGSGPFPLPIGQDKADVHAAFEVVRIAAAKDDPANTAHLQLTPKPKTSLARQFQKIDVWVDGATGMPVRIATLDPDGNKSVTTDLTNVKVNAPVGDSDFALPKIDPDEWQLQEDDYQRP